MTSERINRIEVTDSDELLLGLKNEGNPDYQYVYRAAAGVYWDEKRHSFKSAPMNEKSCPEWFSHIVNVVREELGLSLELDDNATWFNISEQDKAKIERSNAI